MITRARKGKESIVKEQWKRDEIRLWETFLADPSEDNRNELIMHYYEVILMRAHKFVRTRPMLADRMDDLVTAAVLRLIKYLDRYDADLASYNTFVNNHIDYGFREWAREQDPLSRCDRRHVNHHEATLERLQIDLSECPTQEQMDKALGKTWRKIPGTESLSDLVARGDGKNLEKEHLIPCGGSREETAEAIAELLRPFDLRMAVAFYLRFVADFTMKQVGEAIGCSESRVSQMFTQAFQLLREKYRSAYVAAELMGIK